jgi:hypothetical protein
MDEFGFGVEVEVYADAELSEYSDSSHSDQLSPDPAPHPTIKRKLDLDKIDSLVSHKIVICYQYSISSTLKLSCTSTSVLIEPSNF